MLLCDLLESLILGERRVGGSEAGVSGDVNALGLAELDQLGGGAVRVQLDLVDGGGDLGGLEKSLEVLDTEVGNTDSLGLARLVNLLHGLPGVDESVVSVDLLLVLLVQSDRPVHEQKVDVAGLELLERLLNGLLDVLASVVVHLGGEPELGSVDARVLDAVSDLLLVTVGLGTAERGGRLLVSCSGTRDGFEEGGRGGVKNRR